MSGKIGSDRSENARRSRSAARRWTRVMSEQQIQAYLAARDALRHIQRTSSYNDWSTAAGRAAGQHKRF